MASFARLLILGVCLLLAPAAVRAQDYDLYTAHRYGIYRVDLATGQTETMLDFRALLPENTWMNAFLYIPEENAIYATGATTARKYDCYYGYPKDDFWTLPPFYGWKIDIVSWTITELPEWIDFYGVDRPDARAGYGVYYEGIDNCGPERAYINSTAYDTAAGWLYTSWGPANNGDGTRRGHSLYSFDYRSGERAPFVAPPTSWEADGLSDIYSLAVDPVDGSLWDLTWVVSPYGQFLLERRDGGTGSVLKAVPAIPGDGGASATGPVAFYPDSHTLCRYSWDNLGNAWLDQLDLATGQPTRATPNFDAPALAIFFLPKQ